MSLPPKKSPVEPAPESIAAGHEVSDVSIRGIIAFVVALAIAAIVIHVGLWFMHEALREREIRENPAPMPLAALREPPPGPGFEETPGVQLHAYVDEQTGRLESYGWDEAGPRIPIERGIDLALKEINGKSGAAQESDAAGGSAVPAEKPSDEDESKIVPGSDKPQPDGSKESKGDLTPATDGDDAKSAGDDPNPGSQPTDEP